MKAPLSALSVVVMALFMGGCLAPSSEGARDGLLVEIGKQIYHAGIQADGQPVEALVMGDVPVFGDQFTCLHCHRYSGLGGAEGSKYVMPTSAPALFSPRVGLYHERPAYSDESLDEMLRYGVDPGGNQLDPVMPLYDLGDKDMQALIAYLKTLSRDMSPGVSETELHIATVIGPQVSEAEREAMLAVLERFIQDTNGQSRRQEILSERGPFYHEYKNKAYREWVLHTWELQGPPDSWPQQLENYYQQQPVFALLSGIAKGPWAPIHEFSQQFRVPAILPNTDLPSLQGENDFYTLYFSEGLALEVRTVLAAAAEQNDKGPLVQIYRGSQVAEYAVRTLELLKGDYAALEVETVHLKQGETLQSVHAQLEPASAVVIWGDAQVVQDLAASSSPLNGIPLFLSSTLLERDFEAVPEQWQSQALLAHPYNLPQDQETRARRTTAWIKGRGVDMQQPRIQTQTWYASKVFHSGIKHIKRNFYRDYLLDALDHSSRLGPYASNYPRLSFGPNQRFLAKGAYLVELLAGNKSGAPAAEWIVP